MMVKMKDHKFTVPVILNGKTIVIDGMAEEKLTSVEQLRHFAEDAGKSKAEIAKITEPKKEILVQAKGILVL
jgi:cyanophycinase-like exopeptidase